MHERVFDPAAVERDGLAPLFADHLARVRGPAGPAPVSVTSTAPREPPAGSVVVPHLVAVGRNGRVRDRIVWELVPEDRLRRWLPSATPEAVESWTRRLPALRRLRAALRAGTLRDTPSTTALLAALRGRYLSFKFVLEHPALVEAALAELGPRGRG
jgi:hypothetical protein